MSYSNAATIWPSSISCDAGVGAAGMLTLIGLGAGAVAIARRTERQHAVTN